MKGFMLPLGFGFIGIAMLGLAAWLFAHMQSETRIGAQLIDEGVETEALLVSAEYHERLSCRGGTIKACNRSDYAVGQIVFPVDDRRVVTDVTLSLADFTAYEAGEEVRVPILYLPDAPLEIEAARGDRYHRAQSDGLVILVAAIFGVTFAAIGGIAGLIMRRRPPA